MMLLNTPFGFVYELDGDSCYHSERPYEIVINGHALRQGHENVIAVFGLNPDTEYHVELRELGTAFDVRTEPCRWRIDPRAYGAKGDGHSDDTAAIAAALYTAPEGAVLVFPKGEYLVSQVLLKSGVDLCLEAGAVLRHNPDRTRLAILKGYQQDDELRQATINSSWEGNPLDCYVSLVYGKGAQNVRIYGEGALDGSGEQSGFWNNPKHKHAAWRPRNLSLYDCRDITLAGLTSRNSAAWNLHPHRSDELRFYALSVESDPQSPNTDGLNPESCRDVQIVGCDFRVGDDCIAIKAGKPFMARDPRACQGLAIRNCRMREGHGAVVIGSEIACGVRDVRVCRCLFQRTDRGLRIKTRRGRGALSVVDNIALDDVRMDGVRHCLVVNMFYNCDPDGHSDYVASKAMRERGPDTPSVRNVSMRRVHATNITGSAAFVYGLPESPVDGVRIADCRFAFAKDRALECPAMMDDFPVTSPIAFYFENATNLEVPHG